MERNNSKKHRRTKVLLICDGIIPSVRLCGLEQLRYLDSQKKLKYEYAVEYEVSQSQCEEADVVVFVRTASWLNVQIAKYCKRAGKFIIYIWDDDVFEIFPGAASYKYYKRHSTRKKILWMIKNSDVFASPSRHILKKYGRLAKRTTRIEEPCMTAGIREAKPIDGSQKLKIGFAGSVDRSTDLEQILQEALKEFCRKHANKFELEFIGAGEQLADQLRAAFSPYEQDYDKYQEKFQKKDWDIGLAPMPDTEFHKGKHYNKYIEYGSVGCVGIYSDVIPYRYVIRDRENGILCKNTKEDWLRALEFCLDNRDEINQMKAQVCKEMREEFSIEQVSEKMLQTIPELDTFMCSKKRVRLPLRLYKWIDLGMRVFEYVIRNGIYSLARFHRRRLDTKACS